MLRSVLTNTATKSLRIDLCQPAHPRGLALLLRDGLLAAALLTGAGRAATKPDPCCQPARGGRRRRFQAAKGGPEGCRLSQPRWPLPRQRALRLVRLIAISSPARICAAFPILPGKQGGAGLPAAGVRPPNPTKRLFLFPIQQIGPQSGRWKRPGKVRGGTGGGCPSEHQDHRHLIHCIQGKFRAVPMMLPPLSGAKSCLRHDSAIPPPIACFGSFPLAPL